MIGYHCSFEHRGVCYALLEYADKHTLEHLMMHRDSVPPSLDQEILDFWENVLLVIVGIGEIHDLDPDSEDAPEPGRFTGYDTPVWYVESEKLTMSQYPSRHQTEEHPSEDQGKWFEHL